MIQREDIGISILSTDRPECLDRLLRSIEDHTKKDGLRVHVADDSLNFEECKRICEKYSFVTFYHMFGSRLGIAKNTNIAMRLIKKYPYKILFNNDVEIKRVGWEFYYFLSMQQTGIHHFCFQQEGLWGAGTSKRPETITEISGRKIKTIDNFPQGAILAYDQLAFDTVGYFDCKNFKGYGRSHWDWSFRVSDSGIQPSGIHDVVGSNDYFIVHDEPCTTQQSIRLEEYRKNTKVLERLRGVKDRVYIEYE